MKYILLIIFSILLFACDSNYSNPYNIGNLMDMYENDGWTIYDSDNNKDGDFVYSTITCMAVDAKNNVWVGCKGSFGQGVRMFDGHKWTIYNRDNTPIKSSVYCIFIV